LINYLLIAGRNIPIGKSLNLEVSHTSKIYFFSV